MSLGISAPNMVGSLHDICHTHHFPTVLSSRGVEERWEGVSVKVSALYDRFADGLDGQLACWSDLSFNGFLPRHVDGSVATWVPSEALPASCIHVLKEVFPERDVLSIRFPCCLCCLEKSTLLVAASSTEFTAPKTAYSPQMSLDGSQLTASV